MLITKDFVALNNPKTGSTFLRESIRRAYGEKFYTLAARKIYNRINISFERGGILDLKLPNIRMPGHPNDQHGCYCQIPDKYRNLPVVSISRNPYTKFISAYEFGWWKKHPSLSQKELFKLFPSFPDLTIDEYVDYLQEVGQCILGKYKIRIKIGVQTIQFLQLFSKSPISLCNVSDKYFLEKYYMDDMPPIKFLTQENLSNDLYEYLSNFIQDNKKLSFIKKTRKVNVTKSKSTEIAAAYTPKVIEYIQNDEKYLFELFGSYGVNYELMAPEVM